MTIISDLPKDLMEEILLRVPITRRGRVRSTCKGWNVLSNDQSFIKRHCAKAAEELKLTIMIYDSRACLTNINLQNHKEPSIKEIGNFSNKVEVSQVFHCDGLLLFVPSDNTRPLVVCNPYLGQVRLIQRISKVNRYYMYAIGCDNNNNHKILRYGYEGGFLNKPQYFEFEIYYFKSNSWKVLEDAPDDWFIRFLQNDKSIKGYTYFVAYDSFKLFLVCFDFSRERCGPRLHLPFHACIDDPLILSTIREEQLAVLFLGKTTKEIEIWITSKIEPDAVSWIPFLKVEKLPIIRCWIQFRTFFVDEEKKVAFICNKGRGYYGNQNNAYVFGEDGYYKVMDLGTSETQRIECSYAPSSVQIQ